MGGFLCVHGLLDWKANKHFSVCVDKLPLKFISRDGICSAPPTFATWANAVAVRCLLKGGSAPARYLLALVSEVFAGSRCLARALISMRTHAWRTSPMQVLCTSISHLFQSSSPKPITQRDNWIFSAFRIQLCISNSFFCLIYDTFIFN